MLRPKDLLCKGNLCPPDLSQPLSCGAGLASGCTVKGSGEGWLMEKEFTFFPEVPETL